MLLGHCHLHGLAPLTAASADAPQVEFVKSVGLLKGAVEGGAVSSTKQLMKAWVSGEMTCVGGLGE